SSVSFRFEKALGFHGRHAAGAGGGDGLSINAILHVTRVKDAGDAGSRATLRDNVAVLIGLGLALEYCRVWYVPIGHKEPTHVLPPHSPRLEVAQTHVCDDVL